jgi:hypothetical protein
MSVRMLPNVQALQDCAARPERSEVGQPARPRTGAQSEISY